MLETLVSSKIRRTLFEYLLTHPTERFYLRGLAKELALPVSPLRRELKRLERAGMLKTIPEANILFYMVELTSPTFLQLRSAGQLPEALSPATATVIRNSEFGVRNESVLDSAFHIPHAALGWWRSPWRTPALVGATAAGLTVVLIVAGLFYMTLTHQRSASVTVVVPPQASAPAPASGAMRGTRWQVVPGGFGGFSSGASNESY